MRSGREAPPSDPAENPTGLRVLVVAPTPYFADRGCHVRIYEEARALRARGVEVLVVTYPLGRTLDGVPTSRTIRVPWYRKLEAGPSIHKVYIDGLLLLKTLAEIRRFRPHVIHAHLHEGATIALVARVLTRLPFVFDIQGSLADELSAHRGGKAGVVYPIARRVEGFLYRRSDALVVNSTASARMLEGEFGVAPERVTVAPDAVSARAVASSGETRVRARLGLGDGPVIGFLGLMTPYQGVDLLLEALPRLFDKRPDATALLMGFPDEPYRRRAEAAGLGSRVRFTGRVPYEDVTAMLSAATVAVSPKMTSSEGNGKLLDYMAAGLPTVAFDTPVNREILGDDGVLVAHQDAGSLADALIAVLDEPGGRGERLRRRAAEMFSWDRSVDALLRAYGEALSTDR
jgi:glycosyltransferase involved in cell wall biosynthesis